MNCLSTIAVILLVTLPLRGDEPTVIAPKMGWIGSLAFLADGEFLAIGTADSKVCLWDVKKGSIAGTYSPIDGSAVTALHWRRDNKSLFAGTQQGARRIYSIPNVREARDKSKDLKSLRGSVHAITSLQSAEVVSGGMEGVIRIEELGEGGEKQLKGHTSWVNSFSYLDSRQWLVSAGSDNMIRLWNVKTWKSVADFTVKEGEVRSAALSPDGKYVAAGIRYGWVRVWDVESRKEVFSTKAHDGESGGVAFTPDGKTVVSGGGDWNKPGEVLLIDTTTWKTRTTLKHTGEVLCLTLSRDGRWLAAGSWDGTVRLWDLAKGK